MKNIEQKIADFDWQTVTGDINEKSIHFLILPFAAVTIDRIFGQLQSSFFT
jgi:hypothetical protein